MPMEVRKARPSGTRVTNDYELLPVCQELNLNLVQEQGLCVCFAFRPWIGGKPPSAPRGMLGLGWASPNLGRQKQPSFSLTMG